MLSREKSFPSTKDDFSKQGWKKGEELLFADWHNFPIGTVFAAKGGAQWLPSSHEFASAVPYTLNELECFHLWFEFLKRSNTLHWTDEMFEHFGDILSKEAEENGGMEFPEWWWHHSHLFQRLQPRAAFEIESQEEASQIFDESLESANKLMLVGIFTDSNWDDIQRTIRELLGKRPQAYAYDRNFLNGDADWYVLYSGPRARSGPKKESLWKMLDVYDEWIKHGDTKSFVEIEIAVSALRKKKGKNEVITRQPRIKAGFGEVSWDDLPDREKTQMATISRLLKKAQNALDNITQGVFPRTDKSLLDSVRKGSRKKKNVTTV